MDHAALRGGHRPHQRRAALLLDNAELVRILEFPAAATPDAERFSAALGTGTFQDRARSRSGAKNSTLKRPVRERLVNPHELMAIPHDRMHVRAPRRMPRDAMKLAHAPYCERPATRRMPDPNPYVLRRRQAKPRPG